MRRCAKDRCSASGKKVGNNGVVDQIVLPRRLTGLGGSMYCGARDADGDTVFEASWFFLITYQDRV